MHANEAAVLQSQALEDEGVDNQAFNVWLRTPNAALNNRRPIDCTLEEVRPLVKAFKP